MLIRGGGKQDQDQDQDQDQGDMGLRGMFDHYRPRAHTSPVMNKPSIGSNPSTDGANPSLGHEHNGVVVEHIFHCNNQEEV